MIGVESWPPRQPRERNPAMEGFVNWRGKLEQTRCSSHWDGTAIMVRFSHMADYRRQLAPWEWIRCPDWFRLYSRAELRLVLELKVQGEQ